MRVLVIGAHPDDEDTELLTVLTRQYGAEAAYLSLNRGEGGQNLIGPELGVALGILRSEELLSARSLDGAQQFFTRAYDFGYSKTLEDTWAHWPRDTVLADVVRVVRQFKPQVIVSVFSGTPRDGHGQHQAAGWAAAEAFRVAGDSTAFPGLASGGQILAPWTVTRFYRSARFDTTATTLVLDGGGVDLVSGQTWHQLAMASRSRHRSQDMGQLQTIGPSQVRLALVADRAAHAGRGLWEGIDTTLAPVLGADDARTYTALVRAIDTTTSTADRMALLERADGLLLARAPAGRVEVSDQRERLADAWQAVTGTLFDARTARPALASDSRVAFVCEVRSPESAGEDACAIPGASGIRLLRDSSRAADGGFRRINGTLVLEGAEVDQPYYLRTPRDGAMYRWPAGQPAVLGQPFEPSRLSSELTWHGTAGDDASGGQPGRISRRLSYRWNDQSIGELRLPVEVVPPVDVSLSPSELPWRRGTRTSAPFLVTLHNATTDTVRGRVLLRVPASWTVSGEQDLALMPGERRSVRFTVRPPASARDTSVVLGAAFRTARGSWDMTRHVVNYPHIVARGYLEPAESRVTFLQLSLPTARRIAYVRGAADGVPEALAAADIPVDVITGADLVSDRMARYQVLVIGPRAYEVDDALVRNNDAVLAFARNGGRVVVQYQQYGFFFGQLAPYPLFVASRPPGSGDGPTVTSTPVGTGVPTGLIGGHDRVTDETAPVTVRDASSPLLNAPNRIAPRDWDGWVQERGLYFARAWAPEFHSVIAMSDPGEPPLEGGLLIARTGKGSYIYTGLAFFRQLPAGVPGAFRLFANLLSPPVPVR